MVKQNKLQELFNGKVHDHYFSHETIEEEGEYVKADDVFKILKQVAIDAYCEGCKNPSLYETHEKKAEKFFKTKYLSNE